MKNLTILFLITLLGGCTTTPTADYDANTDFKSFSSFQWKACDEEQARSFDDELISQRLKRYVSESMVEKHYQLAETSAELLVKTCIFEHKSKNENRLSIGFGGFSRHFGWGISTTHPILPPLDDIELVIEVTDTRKNTLIWRHNAIGSFVRDAPPNDLDQHIKALVDDVLAPFPTRSP